MMDGPVRRRGEGVQHFPMESDVACKIFADALYQMRKFPSVLSS